MPSSIPYDPSLVLGNIVHPDAIKILEDISALQSNIDSAEDDLNAALSLKRSLEMTMQELTDMGVPTAELAKNIGDVDKTISSNAVAYSQAVLTNMPAIQTKKRTIRTVHQAPESPIDYNKSQVKIMPLAADTLKLNVQYFSFDSESQTAANFVSQIGGFVSDSLDFLGDNFSSQASTQVKNQASSQLENHDVVGTLVMSVACTHKNVSVFAPFILDVDKAVRVWNKIYPSDKLEMKLSTMIGLSDQDETEDAPAINLLSGASFGSSFVGMVHVLNTNSTQTTQSMTSIAASMQEKFTVAEWFAKESGGVGADASFSADIKNLLSSQNITSHVSLVVMGVIPSIKSNELQIGVQKFADFDPDKMMGKLAILANSTTSDLSSVNQSATAAMTGGQMVAFEGATITSVMTGLTQTDDGKNKVLDINSMMTAFQDYVDKASDGNIGVPINYYLKPITKLQIAQMWVAKYFPNKYIDYAGDDSGGGPAPAAGGGTTPTPTPTPAAGDGGNTPGPSPSQSGGP